MTALKIGFSSLPQLLLLSVVDVFNDLSEQIL